MAIRNLNTHSLWTWIVLFLGREGGEVGGAGRDVGGGCEPMFHM